MIAFKNDLNGSFHDVQSENQSLFRKESFLHNSLSIHKYHKQVQIAAINKSAVRTFLSIALKKHKLTRKLSQ